VTASLPDLRSDLAPEWRRAFDWIESQLGGRVVRARRQARWRPAWYLDLECDGEIVPLYFRGDRGRSQRGVYPLEHELAVLQILEKHGIPVPHVYGLCPDPRGIVMRRVPGRGNLATADGQAEREAVLDHYMELLARMHAIDLAAFDSLGLTRPATPEALGLGDLPEWEAAFRRSKSRPEPLIEFTIRWVRRHVPRGRTRASFVCSDAGQFLFDRGRVTAVIDLELAHLGDPALDLGSLRARDLSEPLGDLSRALRLYEGLTEPVARHVLHFHTARFALMTPLACAPLVARPVKGLDRSQYLSWYLVYGRAAVEVIAQSLGLALEAPALPAAEPAPGGTVAPDPTDFETYQADARTRWAGVERRSRELGPGLEADDLDDVARILGRRPASRAEADAALEPLVMEAGPERDGELAAYFHRRSLRDETLVGPALRELVDVRVQAID
jgi:hypothetical protein